MKQLLFVLVLSVVPAFAQEPSQPIVPAGTISETRNAPIRNVVVTGDPGKATPVIMPVALPLLKKPLGTVARELRAAHASDRKAKTVRDDENPIEDEL